MKLTSQRFDSIFFEQLEDWKVKLAAFAASDELSDYVKAGKDRGWFKQNIFPGNSLGSLGQQVDSLLVIDSAGKLVSDSNSLSKQWNLGQNREHPLVKSAQIGQLSAGFVIKDDKLSIVASAPITPIKKRDKILGVLAIVKEVTATKLATFENHLGAQIKITHAKGIITSQRPKPKFITKFTPLLFNESIKSSYLGRVLISRDDLAVAKVIKDLLGNSIAVAWIVVPLAQVSVAVAENTWSVEFLVLLIAGSALAGFLLSRFISRFFELPLQQILASRIMAVDDLGKDSLLREINQVQRAFTKLRRKLLQSSDVNSTILRSMTDGFQLIDGKGHSVDVNQALLGMVNYNRSYFLGRSDPFFYLDEDSKEQACQFLELARSGQENLMSGFNAKLLSKKGQGKEVSIRLRLLEGNREQDQYVSVIVLDRTAEKQQIELEEVAKLKMLGKVAAGVAHNMNNLLTGIMSASSVLDATIDKDPESRDRKMLSAIVDSAKNGSELTKELLQMSKIRDGQSPRRPVEICKVVREVVNLSKTLKHAYRYDIEVSLPDDLVYALCDQSGLHQVLLNLVVNAMDAMRRDGKLIVSLQTDLDPEMVSITVKDQGCGMSPEVQQRIFEPFYTTKTRERKSTFGGSGLGLYSSVTMVDSWGGSIECQSELERGTSFIVHIPKPSSSQAEQLPAE